MLSVFYRKSRLLPIDGVKEMPDIQGMSGIKLQRDFIIIYDLSAFVR